MLRPWDFKIVIRRGAKAAVFLQIAHAIIDEIKRGRLAPGTALPGSRELAESLEINRKTVIQAYAELEAQGWVTTREDARHFRLGASARNQRQSAREPRRGQIPERPDFRLVGTAPNIPLILPEKNMLVFDDGAPDTRQIPVDALARAYRNALAQRVGRGRLGYGDPRGSAELRAAISNMLNIDRGLTTTPDNICLTRGSQMAIYLAARILAGPGDTVVMEELSYPPAREAFRFAGAEVVPVPLDAQGMRVDELEKICRKKRVRAVYVTPHHQFPTTVLMKPDRRMRLLALAAQFGFAIVEDDYDHEFHFVHQPMLPLASADMSGKVVYIGSLSKILSPSLRLGYLVGAQILHRPRRQRNHDDRPPGRSRHRRRGDRTDRFRRTASPYPQGDEALWRAAGAFRRAAQKPVRRPHRIHRARWRPGLLGAVQGQDRSGSAGGGARGKACKSCRRRRSRFRAGRSARRGWVSRA